MSTKEIVRKSNLISVLITSLNNSLDKAAMVQPQDVEMEVVEATETDPKKDADITAVQEIREHLKQIDKAVSSKEPRFILRVLRSLPNTRRKLNANVLRTLANHIYPAGAEREAILVFVEEASNVEQEGVRPARAVVKSPLPEVDAYYQLLALVRLLDANLLEKSSQCGKSIFILKLIVLINVPFSSTIDEQNYIAKSSFARFDCCQELLLSLACS